MGKMKDLLMTAVDIRMDEVKCSEDQAYEWAMKQPLNYIFTYIQDAMTEKPVTYEEAIEWFEKRQEYNMMDYRCKLIEKFALDCIIECRDNNIIFKEDKTDASDKLPVQELS